MLAPGPDQHGRFGTYGGRYVPETLIPALDELEAAVGQGSFEESALAGGEIIPTGDLHSICQQSVDQVRPDESCGTCDENSMHVKVKGRVKRGSPR